ncbi:MAG: S-layer homology domain-containing protein, partial [Clostridia bacterium]
KWYGVSFVPSDLYLDIPESNLGNNTYRYEDSWKESYAWKADTVVYFRVKIALCDASFSAIAESPWSNVTSIGFKASAWALADIQQAGENGLIPQSINGDFTRPITREEIAELSVKLYEKITQKSAESVSPNPFLDCTNPEVLKSYKLAIVEGISANKFSPLALTNREQIATMLFRAAKAIKPAGDFTIIGAPKFADDKTIASWASTEVKFMAKQGFIKGVGNNRFAPKGTTSCEQAIAIALRVYNNYAGIIT